VLDTDDFRHGVTPSHLMMDTGITAHHNRDPHATRLVDHRVDALDIGAGIQVDLRHTAGILLCLSLL
jgi:hypothetical protein